MAPDTYRAGRALAIVAGTLATTAGAALTVHHIVQGGEPLASPVTAAVTALALGASAGALVCGPAWRAGRRALAAAIVIAVIAGEAFGLVSGVERMLLAREERARAAARLNREREIAAERAAVARASLASAEAAAVAEAARGGCRAACRDLRLAADQARERLEAANAALLSAPAPKDPALLARALGLPPALVEIGPAVLFSMALNGLGFVLLAYGAHAGAREPEIAGAAEAAAAGSAGPPAACEATTRAQQVQRFVDDFRAEHGRDPTFSEVRSALNLPRSTASVCLRKALG